MNVGQIIAIGGGGFGRNPKHNKIEKYILSQINLQTQIFFLSQQPQQKMIIILSTFMTVFQN